MPFGPFARRPTPPRSRAAVPHFETLGSRQLLAAASSGVVMLAASTPDSQGVTITYDVTTPQSSPITLGVYRSADSTFGNGDLPVGQVLALPSVDSTGASLTSVGPHTVNVPIAGGLPINPARPYVVVVTNPDGSPGTSDAPSSASFRKYSIAVVTHGGIQTTAWKKNGPPWTLYMAKELTDEGYDLAIPWNWVAASNTPGSAAKQGVKLGQKVLDASATFPTNSPVDIHFIGHSEGAVVNTQAIVRASATASETPQLKAGYWEDTLLDPHAANPDFPGRQYSVASGPIGTIAKLVIDNYQSRARDPLVFVPNRIDASEVFYQQTPANRDHNENGGVYNLWGQVPVPGASTYFNLTPAGIVHGGDNGVYAWYKLHVVPLLGDGSVGTNSIALNGAQVATSATSATGVASGATKPSSTVTTSATPAADPGLATFAGQAQAGTTVYLRASHPGSNSLRTVGEAVANSDGAWQTQIAPLPAGKWRVVASSKVVGGIAGKRPIYATTPLGDLTIPKRTK